MKILVVCDIQGDLEKLSKLVESVEDKIDAIVCPGDFTSLLAETSDFDQLDTIEMILQKLISINKNLVCVPGNNDPHEAIEIFEEYSCNAHNKTKTIGKIMFFGYGGAQTPFNTTFEPTEEEVKNDLKKTTGFKDFVFVTHNPPKDTKLDKIKSGEHVGSQGFRDFILKEKPRLVISAHIFEGSGEDKIGESVLFYPGPLLEGKYGIVELGEKIKCEIKSI